MKSRISLLLIILIATLSSCTQNNGNIGPYFGSWLQYDMTIDGEKAPDFKTDETFWEFQNNIIEISRVDGMYEKNGRWGTWEERDGQLLLNFMHHDDQNQVGTSGYRAPEWLYFTSDAIIDLTIVSNKSGQMTLQWHDGDGRLICYYLRKIW